MVEDTEISGLNAGIPFLIHSQKPTLRSQVPSHFKSLKGTDFYD
ncbi:Hypothetical predicted protein [Pelobates cultripes]|uniref:Uncharacterized protein n=1 Tax=Pelobates cultripes TaxID=61616 RepID=A0AAD1TL82_PELCU|nr:Hypothetical predicted protein [Pelobates cultripes]